MSRSPTAPIGTWKTCCVSTSSNPKNVIDWNGFFGEPFDNNRVQDAMAIDPFVAFGMSGIPDDKAKTINIIKVNLQAADSAGLPSGRAYVDELLAGPKGAELQSTFGLAPLTDLGVLSQHIPASSGITIDNLPLWPYILLEAMSTAEGRHLGVLGSLICAEVIGGSIRKHRSRSTTAAGAASTKCS